MSCIYNHPSQRCHHNGQRTRLSSWLVWADPLLVWDSGNVQHPVVCSPTVSSVHGPRVELESAFLFFGRALSFLNVQRSGSNWCVFWRPAALSTATAPSLHRHHGGWLPQGVREGRKGCKEAWVTAPWFRERCKENTDRERERWGNCGGRVTASVASQCPRQEERELCAADCLTETQAAGWWHFMVTTCNPTNFSCWKSSFSNIEQHKIVVVTTIQRMTHFCICLNSSQKLQLGFVPYGGITYFISSTVWQEAEAVP